jgi:predicted transcriptional regulator
MGIDKTQSALEILKYFYENANREQGITISELRKKILSRNKNNSIWLKSKLGLDLVKDVIKIYLSLNYIKKDKPIIMKDKNFDSYRITQKGKELVEEYRKTKHLKDLFGIILYAEAMKPV